MRVGFFQTCLTLSILGLLSGCSQGPVAWWHSVNHKAEHLRKIEASHKVIVAENERLKEQYLRLERDYLELKAQMESTHTAELSLKATGTLTGRTPSSIAYHVPNGLNPEETLALAFEHFNENRFAEATATFAALQKRPEGASLADASAMYTAGVAWFKLGNYNKAREYFNEATNQASGEQREKIHKKVDLWNRLINRKLLGDHAKGE